jgi:hypothetical protein
MHSPVLSHNHRQDKPSNEESTHKAVMLAGRHFATEGASSAPTPTIDPGTQALVVASLAWL